MEQHKDRNYKIIILMLFIFVIFGTMMIYKVQHQTIKIINDKLSNVTVINIEDTKQFPINTRETNKLFYNDISNILYYSDGQPYITDNGCYAIYDTKDNTIKEVQTRYR